jgi:hypothetical protein
MRTKLQGLKVVGRASSFREWKGTASAVPQKITRNLGFSPRGTVLPTLGRNKASSQKAVPQRLKPILSASVFGTAEAVPFP